jgi:hypothetical protein
MGEFVAGHFEFRRSIMRPEIEVLSARRDANKDHGRRFHFGSEGGFDGVEHDAFTSPGKFARAQTSNE